MALDLGVHPFDMCILLFGYRVRLQFAGSSDLLLFYHMFSIHSKGPAQGPCASALAHLGQSQGCSSRAEAGRNHNGHFHSSLCLDCS